MLKEEVEVYSETYDIHGTIRREHLARHDQCAEPGFAIKLIKHQSTDATELVLQENHKRED